MRHALIDWAERLILVMFFVSFAVANIRSDDWINWSFIALEGLTAWFVLTRRTAFSVSENPVDWALALTGTFLPLLARPSDEASLPWAAAALITGGTAVAVYAKISLNRRFGIAPANRGVQGDWAYSVVRHPMYAGYVVAQVGYLIHNPSPLNFGVYLVAWAVQLMRISREERHLMQDAAYRSYAERVRFRLLPGVY